MRYVCSMTISPAQVAANRTARLVRENSPVLRYSTTTPKREHQMAVELDDVYGRRWTHMPESQVDEFCAIMLVGDTALSDIDHSAKCWCQK